MAKHIKPTAVAVNATNTKMRETLEVGALRFGCDVVQASPETGTAAGGTAAGGHGGEGALLGI